MSEKVVATQHGRTRELVVRSVIPDPRSAETFLDLSYFTHKMRRDNKAISKAKSSSEVSKYDF